MFDSWPPSSIPCYRVKCDGHQLYSGEFLGASGGRRPLYRCACGAETALPKDELRELLATRLPNAGGVPSAS